MLLMLLAGMMFVQPEQSLAADDAKTVDLTKYNPNALKCDMPPGQLLQPLVDCITTPIRAAVLKPATGPTDKNMGLLAFVCYYMGKLVIWAMYLAIAIFGLKVLGLRNNPFTVGLGLLIKLGIIFFIISNFGGLGDKLYQSFDQIVNFANISGTTVWAQIDAFLSDLLGFVTGDTNSIDQGILALLNGSIFAKGMGIMITVIGLFAVGSLLLFIFQAVYLYLSSFLGFGFLLAIAPIFVVFLMFNYTERYFSKWLELIISSVLTPLLLFSFMGIFLDIQPQGGGPVQPGLLRQSVDNVFIALGMGDKAEGKSYVKRCVMPNQPLFSSYMLPTDSNLVDKLACPPPLLPNCSERDRNNGVPTWFDSSLFRSFDYMPFTITKIECGTFDDEIKKNVIEALIILFIYGAIINAMLHRIPDIAQDLANGVNVGISSLSTPIQSLVSMIRR